MPVLPRPLLQWPEKDPANVLDYALDFRAEFDSNPASPTGDTVQTAVWTVPAGITKHDQLNSGTIAIVWLSGGLSGSHYLVQCTATSVQGRVARLAAELPVRRFKAV